MTQTEAKQLVWEGLAIITASVGSGATMDEWIEQYSASDDDRKRLVKARAAIAKSLKKKAEPKAPKS